METSEKGKNMTEKQPSSLRKPLLLALLAGLCGNASLATLIVSQVPFSIFPFIAFALSLYLLYQLYVQGPMKGDTPLLTAAMFIFGALAYSAILRATHPEIGSNFIPLMLALILLAWVAFRSGFVKTGKKR